MDEAKRILDRAQEAPGVDTGKQANGMLTGAFLGGFFGGPGGGLLVVVCRFEEACVAAA